MQEISKIEVLVIDDETDFCDIFSIYLKKHGYKAAFTHRLKEGLRLLNKLKPKVLFLDNHLPDGRGWEHAAKLRATYPDMIINLMSGFNDNSAKMLPLEANLRIIEKPLSMNQIESYLAF